MSKNPGDKLALSVVNLPSTGTKPPSNLGPAGIDFWRSIMDEYDISDAGGLRLLEQAACAYDRAEQLRAQIDGDGVVVRGRNGMREHPSLRGELAARAFICRALQRLGVNLEPVHRS